MVFDKTGTITKGVFEVNAWHGDHDQDIADRKAQLLGYAAIVESSSSPPIAKSLLQAYGRTTDRNRISNVKEISGKGITAVIDGQYAGHIILGDVVKPTSAQAISDLRRSGVTQNVILTGDTRAVPEQTASRLGIDKDYSELLPDGKVSQPERILADSKGGDKVAFVGDGINDAPVLSRADPGIAMGAMGSDAAIEAADVVFMDDEPLKIGKAIRISRKCLRIVWQNIFMALGIKAVCLVLGVFGIVTMWLAIFADVGVMILAVLNAIRAMYVRKI